MSSLRGMYEAIDPELIRAWVSKWSESERELARLCPRRHAAIALELGISTETSQKRVQAMAHKAPPRLREGALDAFRGMNAVKELIAWAHEEHAGDLAGELDWSWNDDYASSDLSAAIRDELATARPRLDPAVIRAYSRIAPTVVRAHLVQWPLEPRALGYAPLIEGAGSSGSLDVSELRTLESDAADLALSLEGESLQIHILSSLAVAAFRTNLDSWQARIRDAEERLNALGPSIDRVHAKVALSVAVSEVYGERSGYEFAKEALVDARDLRVSPVESARALSAAATALAHAGKETAALQACEEIEDHVLNLHSQREIGAVHVAAVRVLADTPSRRKEATRLAHKIQSRSERSDAEATLIVTEIERRRPELVDLEEFVARARTHVGRLLPADRARVLAAASDRLQHSDPKQSAELASESYQLLTVVRDPHLALHALAAIASELAHAGKSDVAATVRSTVAQGSRRIADRVQRAHVLAALVGSSASHDARSASDYAAQASKLGERASVGQQENAHLLSKLASGLAAAGLEGDEYAKRARRNAEDVEDSDQRLFALLAVAQAYLADGQNGMARELLLDVLASLDRVREPTSSWLRLSAVPAVLQLDGTKRAARRLIGPIADPGTRSVAWAEAAIHFARSRDKDAFRVARGGALIGAGKPGNRSHALSRIAIGHAVLGEFEAALEACSELQATDVADVLCIVANEVLRHRGDVGRARAVLFRMVTQSPNRSHLINCLNQSSRALVSVLTEEDLREVMVGLRELLT